VSVEVFCLPNLLTELRWKFVCIRDEKDLRNSAFSFLIINLFYAVTNQTSACFNTLNMVHTRPVGRPRARWADVVQRDAVRLLGVRGWRRRAENRDEWRRLMREDKERKGL
jgi:hypothetical protein